MAGAFYTSVFQCGILIFNSDLRHFRPVPLIAIVVLEALLRGREDHNTRNVVGGGTEGKIHGNHWRPHGGQVFSAGID